MAVESSLSQDLISKSRRQVAETKKKLKKNRSIRISKVPNLKPSFRRSRSGFNWLSIELASDASSVVDISDSLLKDMKATNSVAKKDSSQGGSDLYDATSVKSPSYGSSVLATLNQPRVQKTLKNIGVSRSLRRRAKSRVEQAHVVSSKEASIPQRLLSAEVTDVTPNYLKATSSSEGRKAISQSSSQNSSSISASSDQGSSCISTPKSVSEKSSQTLSRTPSTRTMRITINKTSFKPKRSSLKCSHISEELNVDRETCSSIFKGKKFPEHVELPSDKKEAEQIPTMRVCSSEVEVSGERQQELSELKSPSQKLGLSSADCTTVKKDPDMSYSIEIHAKIKAQFPRKSDEGTRDPEASEITLGEASCHLESQKENLNQMMSSLIKSLSDLKEKSVGRYCNTEVHNSSLVSEEENSDICVVRASNGGDKEHESTEIIPLETLPYLHMNPEDQVNEVKFNNVSESNTSTLAENSDDATEDQSTVSKVPEHHSAEQHDTSTGVNISNSASDEKFVAGLTQVDDTGAKKSIPLGDSETSVSHHEGYRPTFSKDGHISMWHLIQQHMVSSLASDVNANHPHSKNEQKEIDRTDKIPDLQTSADNEKQDVETQSKFSTNQDEELHKAFAIKLVREAIERILLPEVPDQSSDDQSISSETTSEQDLSENHAEESTEKSISTRVDGKEEDNALRTNKELGPDAGSGGGIKQMEIEKRLEHKSENKAPKHWSNLKKWILLQRFIKALEKVRKFNLKEPRHLQVEPDPEEEKIALRHQTMEERKNAEEWMLDYALRQAISQLAPTQKKKVSLLVKAFETVVPLQEVSDIHTPLSRLKETRDKSPTTSKTLNESLPEGNDFEQVKILAPPLNDKDRNSSAENQATNSSAPMVDDSQLSVKPCSNPNEDSSTAVSMPFCTSKDSSSNLEGELASSTDLLQSYAKTILQQGGQEEKERESKLTQGLNLMEFRNNDNDNDEGKKIYIRMWHNVYQHVVSSIVEKVGPKLLDGAEDEDAEGADDLSQFLKTNQDAGHEKYPMIARNGLSRSEAVKLVQEAVNEILVPEIQDDESETLSVTSDKIPDEEFSEKNHSEGEEKNYLHFTDHMKDETREIGTVPVDQPRSRSKVDDSATQEERSKLLEQKQSKPPKPKNWSKLKKLMLLKRSIRALEKARILKSQPPHIILSMANQQPETVDLSRQMIDEREKAEQWMLDYAVQNIVNQLTPTRKRRVSMLVEAFEAVVPLPEM